jgi:hypothetical protein
MGEVWRALRHRVDGTGKTHRGQILQKVRRKDLEAGQELDVAGREA